MIQEKHFIHLFSHMLEGCWHLIQEYQQLSLFIMTSTGCRWLQCVFFFFFFFSFFLLLLFLSLLLLLLFLLFLLLGVARATATDQLLSRQRSLTDHHQQELRWRSGRHNPGRTGASSDVTTGSLFGPTSDFQLWLWIICHNKNWCMYIYVNYDVYMCISIYCRKFIIMYVYIFICAVIGSHAFILGHQQNEGQLREPTP